MIILYSTHCPRCSVLEKKLKSKNINYQEINDVNTMRIKGFTEVPILQVDDKTMSFIEANAWIVMLQLFLQKIRQKKFWQKV